VAALAAVPAGGRPAAAIRPRRPKARPADAAWPPIWSRRIVDLVEAERFVDEADLAGVTVRTTHRLDPLDGGRTRVTYRMEITGPAADEIGPQLGPAITADFPDTMAALVARAQL